MLAWRCCRCGTRTTAEPLSSPASLADGRARTFLLRFGFLNKLSSPLAAGAAAAAEGAATSAAGVAAAAGVELSVAAAAGAAAGAAAAAGAGAAVGTVHCTLPL